MTHRTREIFIVSPNERVKIDKSNVSPSAVYYLTEWEIVIVYIKVKATVFILLSDKDDYGDSILHVFAGHLYSRPGATYLLLVNVEVQIEYKITHTVLVDMMMSNIDLNAHNT